jgi:hypothetical protein
MAGVKEGQYHLAAGEFAGPAQLSGFHVDLKARTYEAIRSLPMGGPDEKVRYYREAEWQGTFSFDAQTGKWVASIPKATVGMDPPFRPLD